MGIIDVVSSIGYIHKQTYNPRVITVVVISNVTIILIRSMYNDLFDHLSASEYGNPDVIESLHNVGLQFPVFNLHRNQPQKCCLSSIRLARDIWLQINMPIRQSQNSTTVGSTMPLELHWLSNDIITDCTITLYYIHHHHHYCTPT